MEQNELNSTVQEFKKQIQGSEWYKLVELHEKFLKEKLYYCKLELRDAYLNEIEGDDAPDIRFAAFSYCSFTDVDIFIGASMRRTFFYKCHFNNVSFAEADLRHAKFEECVFEQVNMEGTAGADITFNGCIFRTPFRINELTTGIHNFLPEGDLIGWKKLADNKIAKLLIPAHAKRSNSTSSKCRASEAVVLEVWEKIKLYDYKGITYQWKPCAYGNSFYDHGFVYLVGETVKPARPFEEARLVECASGIHFFTTRELAEQYI